MRITRSEALVLDSTRLLAQTRPSVAITMDDGRWQIIPVDRRIEAEDRLLSHLGKSPRFSSRLGSGRQPHGATQLTR
jgi:hypothetical protein